jgi:4-hydroxybenzoate polyprenyltransferase
MAVLGAIYAGLYSFPYLLSALASTLLAWQFAAVINDVYDKDIDKVSNKSRPLVKGTISEKTYSRIGIIFLLISLISAAVVNYLVFLMSLLFNCLAILYSVPPIRIRKYIFSEIIIGLGALLSFLIGFFSQKSFLSTETLMIGFIILLGALLASTIKDIKDFEGDRKQKIKTIFTAYGLRKGKRISIVFLLISFLSPILLVPSLINITIFTSITIISLLDFIKKGNVPRIILYYLISITFLILRIKLII